MKVFHVKYTKVKCDGWPDDDTTTELVFEKKRDAYKCALLIARARSIDLVSVKIVEE